MLAALGSDPLGLGTSWKPSSSRKQQSGKHQRRATSQRTCFHGLETKSELLWDNWDLDREFTKTLTLKNVHTKLQKLYIRPPVSKFFIVSTPKTIAINPGITFSILVTFRPLQRCEYEDSIEFQGKNSSFSVRLCATLPRHTLEVPSSVLLPTCAVQHSSHASFLLKNLSKIQTFFQWQPTAPFQLSPDHGLLKPGQACHISVALQPEEALVYQKQAYCRFGEDEDKIESCCTVLLQGLAKYPYLQLRIPDNKENQWNSPVLDFGSVAIGQSLQKHFDIFNPSPVAAYFSLSMLPNAGSLFTSEFICNVTRGKMAPGGSLQAKVTYTPAVVDTVSVEYLLLKCRGALGEIQLKLTGKCLGPKLSLSSSVVDFDCVVEGGAATQTVDLINSSPVEAIYQWDLDCSGHSVFSIQPASGTVRPHSQTTLRAIYRPTQPIAHHRRVACLILHRDPLVLDLIGTCHSELQQPVVLKPEHLVLYKLNWTRRQDQPETLSAIQQDPKVHLEQQGMLCSPEESHHRRGRAASTTPMEEYYLSCSGCSLPSPHLSVVPSELVFNHKKSSSFPTSIKSSQCVSITNHASRKLRLVWTAAPDSPFSVSPLTCDLAPLKVTLFQVTYDPKQLNTLHTAHLECFAYHKDNNDIEHRLLCPPWCLTVRVIGHSFQPGKEHFVPYCSLKPPLLEFPSLSVLSYRTVLLQNSGELPLTFCLNQSSAPTKSISLVPSCGLIQPGNHQILTLRTAPTEESPKQGFSIHLQLNAAEHMKELTVVSVLEKLRVSLEGDGSLYFPPTAVGSRMQRSQRIQNLSNLPLRFRWSIPEPDQRLICVEPEAGKLHPNETLAQIWSFNPLAENAYTLTATLTFGPVQTPGCNESQMTLKVVGTGAKGFIEAERAAIDVGEILVGSCRAVEVPLVNNSPCPVSFSLSVRQTLLDEETTPFQETEPNDLQLTCERSTITSNSTMLVRSTVRLHKRAQYLWTISYQTLNASGCVSSLPQTLCEVRAKGVFPTLKVIDACGLGSVSNLSKVHLFRLFSLDSLNEHLLSSPAPAELFNTNPSRHSLHTLDFNFSAAPLNSDLSTFVLMFYNPGSFPVEWAFLFPEEQKMELKYWAETGQLSDIEMSQMKVQDNCLFSISPRSGILLPDQQMAVHFTYSHDFAGTEQLPVVFKLSHGREVLLNLRGVSVDRDRPYLHFASKRHVFTPVNIGDFAPPRQVYELHNGGSVPVHYKVDLPALSQLQADNADIPVLSCLNPEGMVPPGKTAILHWIFTPLETKTYLMDIPIHVQGGDSTLVRFEGCGLNPSAMSSKNSFTCSDAEASEPCIQKLPFPGQAVLLSNDSLSLGDIPVCSRSSRILFLTNTSRKDTYRYTWDQSVPRELQICPQRGSLSPGESVPCVLTFTSADYPTVYQLDVICEVIQEAALTRYDNALHRWEEEKKRHEKNEFPITDRNLAGSRLTQFDKDLAAAPVRKGPPFRQYKTLPPICTNRRGETVGGICTKVTRAERRSQRQASEVWRRPEPPQPLLLHLEIAANSHHFLEYLIHFPNQINKHYRCNQPFKPQKQETTFSSISLPAEMPSLTHVSVGTIATHVLTSLLRSIFHDPAFTQFLVASAFKDITSEGQEPGPSHCSTIPSSPSSPATPDHAVPLNGAVSQQLEQHNIVVSEGIAECLGETPRTCRVPLDLSEEVLMKTLQDLMMEAISGEFDLTAHPSMATLPPVSTRRANTAGAEQREGSKK